MGSRRILIIGSGKRVCEAALPVIARTDGEFELDGIVSRTPKSIEADGRTHPVLGLETLTQERLAGIDLIYMVVSKPAVPSVLRRLGEFDCASIDLLIETPVMLVRHLGHRKLLTSFRNTWVSEDCTTLPCFDVLANFVATGAIGTLEKLIFDRCAYAYHGMAMVKSVLGDGQIRKARQRMVGPGRRERRIELESGASATIYDPRDYSKGSMLFEGETGSVSDIQPQYPRMHLLEAVPSGTTCGAFRIGDVVRDLSPQETELMGERSDGEGVTAWMDGMKRVGFLALLHRIAAGQGAYSLESAIEDAVVDYHLEKLHFYRSTPLTQPGARLARLGFSLLTRITDR